MINNSCLDNYPSKNTYEFTGNDITDLSKQISPNTPFKSQFMLPTTVRLSESLSTPHTFKESLHKIQSTNKVYSIHIYGPYESLHRYSRFNLE